MTTRRLYYFFTCVPCVWIVLSSTSARAIVGGATEVDPNTPNAVVMIVGSGGTFCTGTAIARNLVLTAAHCVQPGADYKVLDFTETHTPVFRDLKAITVHPSFNMQTLLAHRATSDVALLFLNQPLPPKFAVAQLDSVPRRVAPGDALTIEAYGVTTRGEDKSSGRLRRASLQVTGTPGSLQIRLFDPITKNERSGLGACTGDSGAPLFDDQNGFRKVIGVVSWSTGPKTGAGCGGLTGVTPLLSYVKWILDPSTKMDGVLTR